MRLVQIIICFSRSYSKDDIQKLLNGKIPISWTTVCKSLHVTANKFIELYDSSSSLTELQEYLEEEKNIHDRRFKKKQIKQKSSIPMNLKAIEGLKESNHNLIGNYIYFLVKNQTVVFVGKTSSLILRIADHMKSKEIDFDNYYFKDADSKDHRSVDELRKFYIQALNPENNVIYKSI